MKLKAVVVTSLLVEVELDEPTGMFIVNAPWLKQPLIGTEFESLYFDCLALR